MRPEHWFYTLPLRLRTLFRRNRVEQELDEELRFHLEREVAEQIAHGKTPEKARYAAMRTLGGAEQQKEYCRDARRMNSFEHFLRDLRYALRALVRTPAFTAVTVATLALGIGANSAIFSLIDTVIVRFLPVKSPEQLYFIAHQSHRDGHVGVTWNYPDYRAIRDNNDVFSGVAGYSLGLEAFAVQSGRSAASGSELAHGVFVSGNYFDLLGVSPALGRLFNATDDSAPGASPYVVLSYGFWQSHFNSDTRAIGRKLRINGYPFSVIGVAPPGFQGADVAYAPDLFVPTMMYSQVLHIPFATWNDRHFWWMAAVGRLKPGVPLKAAEAELFTICKQQEDAERKSLSNPKWANAADPVVLVSAAHGYSFYTDQVKKPLTILFVIVAVVLLIACANVANLTLARGASRQREIAVRLSLGASRSRVISELLTESIVVAFLGGVSSILVCLALTNVLLRFMPQMGSESANGITGALDWRIFAFTAFTCLLTALLFGVAPALRSTRPDLANSLKQDMPGSMGSLRMTLRKALVVLQVGLSLPLLVTAGLFTRTLGNLRQIDTGFTTDNVFIASVDPTTFGYKGERTREFYDRLCARVSAIPGVRAASLAMITPLTGASWNNGVTVEGYTPKPGENDQVFLDAVGPRYFEALGTPMLLGNDFTDQDNPAAAIEPPEHMVPGMHLPDPPGRHSAIIDQAFARHFFGARSPIGMHVTTGGPLHSTYEVIGVVKDARYFDLKSAAPPMLFIPVWRNFAQECYLVIRTDAGETQLAQGLRRQIHALDPVIPLLSLRPLQQDVNQNILTERLMTTLAGFFGIVALLLCAVGLYGVIAYAVTTRTREIGIRMAVGATHQSVLWLVFREALFMTACGGAIGAAAAVAATRAVASILYGVSAEDPTTLLLAALALAAATIMASLLPARRAAKVDPMIALRYE